jgi:hypothetical protein
VVLVTVSFPVVAVEGTTAVSFVEDTCVTLVAATPLNLTVEPVLNPIPLIVTLVPYGPLVGEKLVTDSVGVNDDALVTVPAAVVTEILDATASPFGTVAVICDAEDTVNDAANDPNFTLLAPLKFDPVIVTELPVIPLAGEKPVIVGATCGVTV